MKYGYQIRSKFKEYRDGKRPRDSKNIKKNRLIKKGAKKMKKRSRKY